MSATGPGARVQPARPGDPARVGPYRIIGRLGVGGMGTVHAALAPDGLRVAVKVVHASQAGDPEFRARFKREVELSARVTGPCLIPLLAADPDAGSPWLATAYVPGPTLNQHLTAHGPLEGGSLYAFAAGTAQALSVIPAGVVHRDVKPQNVILTPAGPRVLDFGIAHAADGTSVTRTGVMTGTPGWISPEHYRTGTAGPPGDMFAWGALVAHAATGRLPFGSGAPDVVAFRVMSGDADLGGLPDELRPVVQQALAKAPEDWPAAAETAETCAGLLAAQGTQVVAAGMEPTLVGDLMTAVWDLPTLDDPAWDQPAMPYGTSAPYAPSMPYGTSAPHHPSKSSRKRVVGAVLIAATLLGGLVGGAVALVPVGTGNAPPAAAPGTATPSGSPPVERQSPAADTAGTGDAAGTGKTPQDDADGPASLESWSRARPAQGRGEHDVARALLHDVGLVPAEGMELFPGSVKFHETRGEVYLSYRLTGDEAGKLYTETEIAAAMCLTLRDVVLRLHPDLPYRDYVMVNETRAGLPHLTWTDDFVANTRCLSATDKDSGTEGDTGETWLPTDAGLSEAAIPSVDGTEIRVAHRAAKDIITATNAMRQTLGTDRTLGHDDISVGFDPDGSALYVWSHYVMWDPEQLDAWGAMAAGEACRSLVRQKEAGGGSWPYIHYAVAVVGASGYQMVRSGTAGTNDGCPA